MQCNRTCNGISWHIKKLVEHHFGFVPIAKVVPVEFAQVSKRSRICRVHSMSLQVQPFGSHIVLTHLSDQTVSHDLLNTCTLPRTENWSVRWITTNLFNTQFL